MAIDVIARGLATSLIGSDGKVSSDKMPVMADIGDTSGFVPVGRLNDPSAVAGKTAEEILLMMLFGVVNPTFTDPSISIALSENVPNLIIGRSSVIEGALIFDRGTIVPAYGTSGYRSGPPTSYVIDGRVLENPDFSIEITPTQSTVELFYSAVYAEGEQPYNSVGNAYDQPLAAGFVSGSLRLNAAYALYNASGADLPFIWFEDNSGSGYLAAFVSESGGQKQTFAISNNIKVVGIKALNFLTQQWEWLGGTAENSLTHFDTQQMTGDSLGEETSYTLYTHNQPASGARELRIYVTE